jgi:carboxyl-terminal processing protease
VLTVVSPIEDTPALRAGIKSGDQIIKIDNEFTKDMTLLQAVKLMRGPRAARSRSPCARERPDWIDVTLKREVIQIQQRQVARPRAALRLSAHHAVPGAHRARRRRRARRAREGIGGLQGLVLDLRNNPGGLLSQAVKVSDLFLDSGWSCTPRAGSRTRRRSSTPTRPASVDYPDGRARQRRAAPAPPRSSPVLCRTTSGRWCSARRHSVKDRCRPFCRWPTATRRSASPRRATSRPNGRSIQATGITPDIIMEPVVQQASAQPDRPDAIRERNLPRHLENGKDNNNDEDNGGGGENEPRRRTRYRGPIWRTPSSIGRSSS